MPECRTVRHPVSPVPDWKKLTMPKHVRKRTKLTQSGIFLVRYRTKIRDAGMPMPALVSSMPMPSYDGRIRPYRAPIHKLYFPSNILSQKCLSKRLVNLCCYSNYSFSFLFYLLHSAFTTGTHSIIQAFTTKRKDEGNLMFAAMLTGPRINSHSELLHMIYFNLQRRKMYSIR
jgi:hypothetical protein